MDRVLDETEAKLIWATTTPVNERWHHARKGFDRSEDDVIAYNERAWSAATRFGVPIDDLYGVVMRAGRDEYLQEDGVHFTAAGYALLGRAVVEAVRLFL
jgi:lysophospholipase L1-like esterase